MKEFAFVFVSLTLVVLTGCGLFKYQEKADEKYEETKEKYLEIKADYSKGKKLIKESLSVIDDFISMYESKCEAGEVGDSVCEKVPVWREQYNKTVDKLEEFDKKATELDKKLSEGDEKYQNFEKEFEDFKDKYSIAKNVFFELIKKVGLNNIDF